MNGCAQRRALDSPGGLPERAASPHGAVHGGQPGGRVEGATETDSKAARVAAGLLRAASLPLARRRELAAAYGRFREAGASCKQARQAAAADAGLPVDVLRLAVTRAAWDCPDCGRQSFTPAGGGVLYLDGAPAAACCVESRATPRAR